MAFQLQEQMYVSTLRLFKLGFWYLETDDFDVTYSKTSVYKCSQSGEAPRRCHRGAALKVRSPDVLAAPNLLVLQPSGRFPTMQGRKWSLWRLTVTKCNYGKDTSPATHLKGHGEHLG